jgi:hypothetical protein
MPAAAQCHPGQPIEVVPTVAFANCPVLIRRGSGVSDDFGTTQGTGTVKLKSNDNGAEAGMGWILDWKPDRIVVLMCAASPGSGDPDETFKVRVFKNGNTNTDIADFEANPVVVIGPVGGFPLPPVHLSVPTTSPLVVPVA